ncbi:MAG: CPBP family intramembrane metalloprotease [Planctomycetes bacterium]|nr:CPBP family intramembrane metalloprotease [Planctomycetota bacterium]
MLAVSADSLQVADIVVQVLGGLAVLAYVVHLRRRGELRNPLAGVHTLRGPPLAHAGLATLLFFAFPFGATIVAANLLGAQYTREAADVPGSHIWHVLYAGQDLGRLVACALFILLLWRYRSFPPRTPALCSNEASLWPDHSDSSLTSGSPTAGRIALIGVVGFLVLLPLCSLQLQMDKILWRWLNPEATQPVHVVLRALQDSAWGNWGTLHLFVMAAVVAPLAEEVFFRGVLLQAIWGYTDRAWTAVFLSALTFGVVHLTQPQDVLPLFTMGLVLGYIRLRYRSLAVCVIIHMLFNLRTMLIATLAPELLLEAVTRMP